MGNSSSQQRQNRGNDLRYDIDISLEDAFSGSQKEIQITLLLSVKIAMDQAHLRRQDNFLFNM